MRNRILSILLVARSAMIICYGNVPFSICHKLQRLRLSQSLQKAVTNVCPSVFCLRACMMH